jgi:acetyl-CoA synthetase
MSEKQSNKITETEFYHPSEKTKNNANIKEYDDIYKYSVENREKFWAQRAEKLQWFKPYDTVLDSSNPPFYKWFTGGKINIVHNAVDRHLANWRRNKIAVIWEGEPGDTRIFSYHELNREISKLGNILKCMGVKKGDIVTIYMPQIPELLISMLACAKIGAAHSVVYRRVQRGGARGPH